jgi:RNA recognition motif-containing protein
MGSTQKKTKKKEKQNKNKDVKGKSTIALPEMDDWKKQILSMLKGAAASQKDDDNGGGKLPVKKLRRMVVLALLQHDEDEYEDEDDNEDKKQRLKVAKKMFKKTIQMLEGDGVVLLDADGVITLLLQHDDDDDDDDKKMKKKKKKKRKLEEEEKEEKKKKKRQRTEEDDDDDARKKKDSKKNKKTTKHDDDDVDQQDDDDDEEEEDEDTRDTSAASKTPKNSPCPGNPQGITRLFLGNLPFAIDDQGLGDFFAPSVVTHIQWITDKETGKFYGSAFIEMESSQAAARAVQHAGKNLSGRPIKINFAPARPGDVWPPPTKIVTGGSTAGDKKLKSPGSDGGGGIKPMSEKPDGCLKLFIGNLSYEIDDDKLKAFFASVDAEVKAVRWLHHKENGDFKGWYVQRTV